VEEERNGDVEDASAELEEDEEAYDGGDDDFSDLRLEELEGGGRSVRGREGRRTKEDERERPDSRGRLERAELWERMKGRSSKRGMEDRTGSAAGKGVQGGKGSEPITTEVDSGCKASGTVGRTRSALALACDVVQNDSK
jgi:hypothetical protein